jgi:hypothetical protein
MIFHDVEQNTDEWLDLRSGKLTGSAISKVMANYSKPFGEPAKKLAANIAVEQLTGHRLMNESFSNVHMERGHKQEPIARMLYEQENFVDVSNGGFFDCGFTACSPDGLVDSDGVIEIKSVVASVHYASIKRNNIDPSYKWQIFFNLKETQRNWIDFISYCADFPLNKRLFVYRVYASQIEEEFSMLSARIAEFKALVDDIKKNINK